MKQGRNISFYIEIVVMLAVSVLVIAVLANAFSRSEMHSRSAGRLSDAVTLASSGAEAFLAAEDIQELKDILNESDNASVGEGATPVVTATYNDQLEPSADGMMKLVISWEQQEGFVNSVITVYYNDEEIYGLETGSVKEVEG